MESRTKEEGGTDDEKKGEPKKRGERTNGEKEQGTMDKGMYVLIDVRCKDSSKREEEKGGRKKGWRTVEK